MAMLGIPNMLLAEKNIKAWGGIWKKPNPINVIICL